MPVTYSIDLSTRTIRTTCSNPLTFTEVIEHFRTLYEDPVCAGYFDVLLDVSTADAVPQGGQIGAVSAQIAAIREKVQFGFLAIVATRDAMFGMMRMFEVLAGAHFRATGVFRNSGEAEAWMKAHQMASDSEDGSDNPLASRRTG
jgi:hypothetical protein